MCESLQDILKKTITSPLAAADNQQSVDFIVEMHDACHHFRRWSYMTTDEAIALQTNVDPLHWHLPTHHDFEVSTACMEAH